MENKVMRLCAFEKQTIWKDGFTLTVSREDVNVDTLDIEIEVDDDGVMTNDSVRKIAQYIADHTDQNDQGKSVKAFMLGSDFPKRLMALGDSPTAKSGFRNEGIRTHCRTARSH